MAISVGDRLPMGTLAESTEFDPAAGCPINPQDVAVAEAVKGKRIVIFGVPGAFTPTCSAKHLPGYVRQSVSLKAKQVDEIWCVATNDAFVMAAWGRDQQVKGAVRMLADGSAAWAKALGLEFDLTARGMGVRLQRFSLLVEDGVVTRLNVEAPGKFEVSDADSMLRQLA
jgi:glutaredoxin/glutathione-dependent peroxiredoxin